MTETPHTTELLLRVMGITGEDALLPLEVLINLHRRQLRAPLEALARVEADKLTAPGQLRQRTNAIVKWLDAQWPSLDSGKTLMNDERLSRLSAVVQKATGWSEMEDVELMRVAGDPEPIVGALILEAVDAWTPYDPLYVMHQLTWPQVDMPVMFEMIEVELALDPTFEKMANHFIGA
jgi:hypothetical protein